jgi:hypothetical protein
MQFFLPAKREDVHVKPGPPSKEAGQYSQRGVEDRAMSIESDHQDGAIFDYG